jgi:hypothetical protein
MISSPSLCMHTTVPQLKHLARVEAFVLMGSVFPVIDSILVCLTPG